MTSRSESSRPRLCHKCRRITEYGPRPVCGRYSHPVPYVEFAGKCRHYDPYPELEKFDEADLAVLLKEPRRHGGTA